MKVKMMRFILFLLCLMGFAQVSGQKMTEFEQLVEELRLDENVVDLSDSGNFSLDEPRLAYANLTGISTMPRSKHITEHAWLEVYDGAGHYFRKRILIHGQGGYSLRYPKNNASFTFCEDNWKGELTTDIRFGDWVKQDGFHLKAFYTDFCRATRCLRGWLRIGFLIGRGEDIWTAAVPAVFLMVSHAFCISMGSFTASMPGN